MAELKDVEIIKVAANEELKLARKRIAELELEAKSRGAISRRLSGGLGFVVLLAGAALLLSAAAAGIHRVLIWGWP